MWKLLPLFSTDVPVSAIYVGKIDSQKGRVARRYLQSIGRCLQGIRQTLHSCSSSLSQVTSCLQGSESKKEDRGEHWDDQGHSEEYDEFNRGALNARNKW